MEKTKHTPGPWRKGIPLGSIISDHRIFFDSITRFSESELLKDYGGYLVCESVAYQNENIIIAAPDMLIVLRDTLKLLMNMDEDAPFSKNNRGRRMAAITKLAVAIAKAEGDKP